MSSTPSIDHPGSSDSVSHRARRVWVVGSCGSGKTTLARRIGELLGIPAAHVDDYIWLPDWKLRDRDVMLGMIEDRLAGDDWVMEGNLGRDSVRLWKIADRADLIVWLDLPLRLTFARLVKRCLRRSLFKEECCNGNFESLRQTFFSRHSILLYALATRHKRKVIYGHMLKHRPHVRLRTAAEVRGWIEAMALPLERRALERRDSEQRSSSNATSASSVNTASQVTGDGV